MSVTAGQTRDPTRAWTEEMFPTGSVVRLAVAPHETGLVLKTWRLHVDVLWLRTGDHMSVPYQCLERVAPRQSL